LNPETQRPPATKFTTAEDRFLQLDTVPTISTARENTCKHTQMGGALLQWRMITKNVANYRSGNFYKGGL
jgi:hypothetical protein